MKINWFLWIAILSIILIKPASELRAQSISHFRVGQSFKPDSAFIDGKLAAYSLGNPYSGKWILREGTQLTLYIDSIGKRIVAVELDWTPNLTPLGAEFGDMVFGLTTGKEIDSILGSAGFMYKKFKDTSSVLDSTTFSVYNVDSTMNTAAVFVTSGSITDDSPTLRRNKSVLTGMILANKGFLDSLWGKDTVATLGYHSIIWQSINLIDPPSYVAVDQMPVVVHRESPIIPDIARRARLEGSITVRMLIDRKGRPRKLRVVKSDADIFNDPGLLAAREYVFTPAYINGRPVETWVTTTIDFSLKSDHSK